MRVLDFERLESKVLLHIPELTPRRSSANFGITQIHTAGAKKGRKFQKQRG